MEDDKKTQFKKFTQGYTFKILLLIMLSLLLLIPISMIKALIYERNRTAAQAEEGIMEAWGSRLAEAGPVIAIPGVKTSETRSKTDRDGEKIEIVKTPFTLVITPKRLDIAADFKTEIRKRGIFSVPLFSGTLKLAGDFDPSAALASLDTGEQVFFNQAELVIVLSSQKGIRKINSASWDGNELFFQPGNRALGLARFDSDGNGGGIFAALPAFKNSKTEFNIDIAIQGGQYVRFLPVGQDTHVKITTDWSSPSFQGSFLPSESNISESGFDAVWDVSYLSRDIPLFWKAGGADYTTSLFGVNFFRAIDTYSLNTRAVKYAILFLIVPFLTLFLLEIFAARRIHPVPYLLSGIANVVFYLLLLSLSEQMQFYLAYSIAAFAVTLMMTFYSRSLLPSWNKSWYMALTALLSYILLYAVLNAESYALLIGSVGTFVVVALVMFLTRKLDWYGRGDTGAR
ncbi:MAG: cell envelope integrity protein CreD [Spirochaetaceae bacterium]|jgi:inner membrane protein|nr:cell envelope integrity protein CreD [Spirochaetaceae bacterium]